MTAMPRSMASPVVHNSLVKQVNKSFEYELRLCTLLSSNRDFPKYFKTITNRVIFTDVKITVVMIVRYPMFETCSTRANRASCSRRPIAIPRIIEFVAA